MIERTNGVYRVKAHSSLADGVMILLFLAGAGILYVGFTEEPLMWGAVALGSACVVAGVLCPLRRGVCGSACSRQTGAEDNTNVKYDAAGDPVYLYYWDGKEVSGKEYELALSSVFDDSKAVSPDENSCTASDIISMIMSF
jgi:hypothetical protein